MGGLTSALATDLSRQGLADSGYPEGVGVPLGVILLLSVLLYLVPRTAGIGIILLTGYLGGAVATHVRMGDPFYMSLPAFAFATLLWIGLIMRDRRFAAVLPS
jgi:hypothetical protein